MGCAGPGPLLSPGDPRRGTQSHVEQCPTEANLSGGGLEPVPSAQGLEVSLLPSS